MRGGAGDDDFDDYTDEPGDRPVESSQTPPSRARVGAGRPGGTQGQERTVSYQPEERYWTDYLRVALPVVGLLLMLGLFWYWASSIIGDDSEQAPKTPTAAVAVMTEAPPSPTPTQPIQITTQPIETPVNTPAAQATNQSAEPTAEPTQAADADFAVGSSVVTVDSVRMRTDPSTATDDNIIEELDAGVTLNVIGESVEAEGRTWINVEDPDTGNQGYVAAEFLEAA